jgi:hypothetical protein
MKRLLPLLFAFGLVLTGISPPVLSPRSGIPPETHAAQAPVREGLPAGASPDIAGEEPPAAGPGWFRDFLEGIQNWFDDLFQPEFPFRGKLTPYAGPCSPRPPVPGLEGTSDRNLRKLKQYQDVCESFVTDTLMFFTSMPDSHKEALELAADVSRKLKEFARYRVHPIVIVEPETESGTLNFETLAAGVYDPYLETFFTALKDTGLSDDQLGTWVPFPEANLPLWNKGNFQPEQFGILVNRFLGMLKRHFPAARGSILLDASTYEDHDRGWQNGMHLSLLSYIRQVDPQLVDSFGIQGFPWVPPKYSWERPVVDPAVFLRLRLAEEAAAFLGTRNIWINTGTFGRKHVDRPARTVAMSPRLRASILAAVILQAETLERKGYRVSINLFAEDKSAAEEATDWSYWQTPGEGNPGRDVFRDFMRRAAGGGIPVSLFDQAPADPPGN